MHQREVAAEGWLHAVTSPDQARRSSQTEVSGVMLVRAYAERDAAALAATYRSAVQEIGPRDYSCEQVAAWLSLAPSAEQVHSLYTDGRTALVAVDARDQPLAFGDLDSDGHIGYLYCSPEAAGTGVTPSVYELEAEARSRPVSRSMLKRARPRGASSCVGAFVS